MSSNCPAPSLLAATRLACEVSALQEDLHSARSTSERLEHELSESREVRDCSSAFHHLQLPRVHRLLLISAAILILGPYCSSLLEQILCTCAEGYTNMRQVNQYAKAEHGQVHVPAQCDLR